MKFLLILLLAATTVAQASNYHCAAPGSMMEQALFSG
jgi:hypothetical protein